MNYHLIVNPPAGPGPCDPRPLLLAAALSGKFSHADLPPELEWARAGYAHCLPPVGEPSSSNVYIPADTLCGPEHLVYLAEQKPADGLSVRPASAQTAYHWFHDTVALPQLAQGPVRFGGPQPGPGVPLVRPQEGRALWLEVVFLEHAGPLMLACGRTAFGREVRQDLGPVMAELRPGAFAEPPPPSPHAAFRLAGLADEAVGLFRAGSHRFFDLVNAAWAAEAAAGAPPGASLAVAAALEGGPGRTAARPTPEGLLVVWGNPR